jgi:cytosine/uracil/thiamine/allantoin permease
MKILEFLDDLLLLAGCICILYGLSLWSVILTWIVGGLMLIGWSLLIGKVSADRKGNGEIC